MQSLSFDKLCAVQVFVTPEGFVREYPDFLCMISLVHASSTREHDNNEHFQQDFRRAALWV